MENLKFELIQANGDASFSYRITGDFSMTVKDFIDYVMSERSKYSLRIVFYVENSAYKRYQNSIEYHRNVWNYSGKWLVKVATDNFSNMFFEKTVINASYVGGYGHDAYYLYLAEDENGTART